MEVKLTQVEITDLSSIKILFNAYKDHLSEYREISDSLLKEEYEYVSASSNVYRFAIKVSRNEFHPLDLVGICGIQNIDWVSRNADLFFIMQDPDNPSKNTIPPGETAKQAFNDLIKFGFSEIGLNKLTFELVRSNEVSLILDGFGFVAEGVKREARYKNGKYIDVAVYSLLSQEYLC